MGKYLLVGFLPGVNEWFARQRGGYYFTNANFDELMKDVRACKLPVVIDKQLSAREALKIVGACTFLGVTITNEDGVIQRPTPVIEAKVHYVTREQLGNLIPDGWMIECQLNSYSGCFGEELQLPYRRKLEQAIADIREFLSRSILQNSQDLVASIQAEDTLEQVVMEWGLVSSDSRDSGAVDAVRRT